MKAEINAHSSICIDGTIWFDCFSLKHVPDRKAEVIFITHPHYDHLSLEDIAKVADGNTAFVATDDAAKILKEAGYKNIVAVKPNERHTVRGIPFVTFAAYNVGKPFHPEENGWVGYIAEIGGEKIAVTGDTDATKDLLSVRCDVLFLPVGGKYTMTAEEAAGAAAAIAPRKAVPTHYGSIVGGAEDGKRFKKLLNGSVDCEILI